MEDFIDLLRVKRLPFKYMTQDVYPQRTIDQNDYYFGVVCTRIADAHGLTVEEVHEGYSHRFRVLYCPNLKNEWEFRRTSTTEDDIKTFWDYVERVRIDAEVELHIQIELPNECFVKDELKFATDPIWKGVLNYAELFNNRAKED